MRCDKTRLRYNIGPSLLLNFISETGGGEGGEMMTPQCGFCRKLPSKQWNETTIVCDVVNRPPGLSDATECIVISTSVFYVAGLDLTST